MPDFIDIPVGSLELDRQNPRLPSRLKGADDLEILQYLARRTNLEELITSIGENDFFSGEAIVVTKSEAEDGKYIVLEGNRRLTALKLLQDPELAKSISSGIAESVSRARNRPSKVPAYEVDSRNDVLQYLGFRHISGVQRWDPLAKARYLKMLYDQTSGEPESRYRQIASEIGSRQNAVRKNLDALAAYEVIERNDFFGIPSLREENFQFGVFYTALANPQIASFTGAREHGRPTNPIENPENLKHDAIEEIVEWIFKKDEGGKTRLGESRNLSKLGEVVSAPKALERFRQGATLEEAHRQTPDIRNEFIHEIKIATHYVESANSKISSVSGNDPGVQQAISDLKSELDATMKALDLEEDSSPGEKNVGA